MKQSNGDFICKCGLCGNKGLALSELVLKVGYGSSYDGEVLAINVCGECADKVYIALFNEKGCDKH